MRKHRFSKDNQPARRRGSNRLPTLRKALNEAVENGETGFLEKVIITAFGDDKNPPNIPLMIQILNRVHPPRKPVLEKVAIEFPKSPQFPEGLDRLGRAHHLLNLAAQGELSIDYVKTWLQCYKIDSDIELAVSLTKRLERLEMLAGIGEK